MAVRPCPPPKGPRPSVALPHKIRGKWYARLHPASRAQTCIKFNPPAPRGAYARASLRGKDGAKNPRHNIIKIV